MFWINSNYFRCGIFWITIKETKWIDIKFLYNDPTTNKSKLSKDGCPIDRSTSNNTREYFYYPMIYVYKHAISNFQSSTYAQGFLDFLLKKTRAIEHIHLYLERTEI